MGYLISFHSTTIFAKLFIPKIIKLSAKCPVEFPNLQVSDTTEDDSSTKAD